MLLSEEMKRFKLFLLLLLFLLNYIFLNKTIFNISLQLIAILTIIQYTLLSLNGKTKELFNQHTQAIYDCISYFVIAKTIFNKIFDIATNKEEFVIFCVFVFFMVIILRFILILED